MVDFWFWVFIAACILAGMGKALLIWIVVDFVLTRCCCTHQRKGRK